MTRITDTQSKRRSSAVLTASVILTASLAFGTFASSASADERGWERRENRQHHHWNGGYYRAPPVIYNRQPYYSAPPLVYGPGVGLNFNFR